MKKVMKKAQSGTAVSKAEANKKMSRAAFKTADSLRSAKIPFGKDIIKRSEANRAKADSIEKAVEKRLGVPRSANLYDKKKMGGKVVKKKK
jgi:hypothetical protein